MIDEVSPVQKKGRFDDDDDDGVPERLEDCNGNGGEGEGRGGRTYRIGGGTTSHDTAVACAEEGRNWAFSWMCCVLCSAWGSGVCFRMHMAAAVVATVCIYQPGSCVLSITSTCSITKLEILDLSSWMCSHVLILPAMP